MVHLLHLLHQLQELKVNGMAKIRERHRDGLLLLRRQGRPNQAHLPDGPVLLQNLVGPLQDDYPTLVGVRRGELDDLAEGDSLVAEELRHLQASQRDCYPHEVVEELRQRFQGQKEMDYLPGVG
jgi:hypothetical protein